jgi:outer membrane receptor protein involved in Fe transport
LPEAAIRKRSTIWTTTCKGGRAPNEITWKPPLAFTASDDVDNTSWRIGAQYFPVPSTNLYFSVARGFKGVAVLTDTSVTPSTAFVPPEIPTAYELGLKKSWQNGLAADRRRAVPVRLR